MADIKTEYQGKNKIEGAMSYIYGVQYPNMSYYGVNKFIVGLGVNLCRSRDRKNNVEIDWGHERSTVR